MAVKIDTTYEVEDREVFLTVIIGNAQLGISLVRLDDKEIVRGEISNALIGKGTDISGKTLSVKSVVTDVNDKTNLTTIRYILKGGKQERQYDLQAEVEDEGDSIIYRANFLMNL